MNTTRGEVTEVLVDHITEVDIEVEVLSRNHAGKSVRTDESVVITTEGEVQRSRHVCRRCCLECAHQAGFTRACNNEAVVILRSSREACCRNFRSVVLTGINGHVEADRRCEGDVC